MEDILNNKYTQAFAKYNTDLNDDSIKNEVTNLLAKHLEENNTEAVKKFLFGSIELTSLKPTDSDADIIRMVEKVNDFDDKYPHLPHVATICVYPNFANTVSEALDIDGVEIACVSGSFPSSQTFIEIKIAETALAIKDGATEIDMVMPVFLKNEPIFPIIPPVFVFYYKNILALFYIKEIYKL